jgi:hypothetical protein
MSVPVRRWAPFLAALALIRGLGAFWQADRERRTDHVGNRAVVDAEATTEVPSVRRHHRPAPGRRGSRSGRADSAERRGQSPPPPPPQLDPQEELLHEWWSLPES